MPSPPIKLAVVLTLLAAALPAPAAQPADVDPEIALQRALDLPVTLSLQSVPISEAFKQISAAAQVPLKVDPACYELLPYGETTRVSVDFKQSKLRDALDSLLISVGLQTTVAGNSVLVRPSSPLKHIGRRAEWEELKLLRELWISPDLKPPAPAIPFNFAEAIRAAMEGRKDLQVPLPTEPNGTFSPAQQQAFDQIAKQPMSAYRALEMYCQLTGTIWLVEAGPLAGGPTGGKILILSPKAWINRQLERPIQISRTGQPLEVIVNDLTNASGIRFVPEPGLYAAVPVVTLRSDNSTVRQTLEALAGATRIAFDLRDESILLYMSSGPGEANSGKPDNIVGRISVPAGGGGGTGGGVMMDVFIHESDLTPEQNALRKKRIDEALKGMAKTWETNPSPIPSATLPASQPATQPKGD